MKKIAIEEHFTIQEQLDASHAIIEGKYPVPEVVQQEKMLDRELPFIYPSLNQDTVNKLTTSRIFQIVLQQMDLVGIGIKLRRKATRPFGWFILQPCLPPT